MNLRSRVALAGAVVVVGAVAAVGAVEYPAIRAGMRANVDAALLGNAKGAPDQYKGVAQKLAMSGGDDGQGGTTFTVGSGLLQVMISPQVGQSLKFVPLKQRDLDVAAGTAPPYFQDVRFNGTRYRVLVAPIKDTPGALLRVALPEQDDASLNRLMWLLGLLTPGAGLLALVGARLLAGRVLSPVGRLTAAAEHVTATGDLSTPIDVRGKDEVARLGLAFNAMTAALDGSVGAQRRLVADASHELRTPLTSLTTNLELLAERPDDPQAPALVTEALGQARELTALINDLVDLARFGERSLRSDPVRLDRVAEEVAERRAGLDITVVAAEPAVVLGDRDALERVVANLVDNAVKFGTRAEVSVVVRESSAAREPVAVVEVRDDGPGIPDADLPYVFDRFHRSPAARAQPGSGLGLAIVRQIVTAHGGTVAASRAPGGGALLRVTLPAVPADPDGAAR